MLNVVQTDYMLMTDSSDYNCKMRFIFVKIYFVDYLIVYLENWYNLMKCYMYYILFLNLEQELHNIVHLASKVSDG